MFCKKCGKLIKEGAAFCASCGTPVAAGDMNRGSASTVEKRRKPKSKKEHVPMSKKKKTCIILSTVAAVLIAAFVSGSIYYLQSPALKAAALFADGNPMAAFVLYNNEGIADNKLQSWIFSLRMNSEYKKAKARYENNEIDCATLLGFISSAAIIMNSVDESWENTYNEILNQRCDEIKASFDSGEMSYSDASAELLALEELDLYGTSPETYTSAILAHIENKQAQFTEYDRAIEMYESGDLEGAIESFSLIDAENPKYVEAQEMYAAAVEEYRNDVIRRAEFTDMDSLSQAIILLKHALLILDGDTELTAMLENFEEIYAENIREDAMIQSTELIAEGEYVQALRVLADALDEIGPDAILQSAYDECADVYVQGIVAKAEQLMQNRDFSGAISLINTALQVLPDNSTLLAKKAEVEEAKPLSITDALMINSLLFSEWNSGAPIDPFGNDYSRTANYAIIHRYVGNSTYSYEEYRVYGRYSTITGTIAPYYETPEDSAWWLQIYADDRLVYTSPVVGRKTDAIDFSVNISGADYIKLVIAFDCYTFSGILSNVLLWK